MCGLWTNCGTTKYLGAFFCSPKHLIDYLDQVNFWNLQTNLNPLNLVVQAIFPYNDNSFYLISIAVQTRPFPVPYSSLSVRPLDGAAWKTCMSMQY